MPTRSFHASPSRPALTLPQGACDAHVHVFGPATHFAFAEDAPFVPADAPKETLFALHRMLGIEHCVIVQSTCHGFDNSVVADAIAATSGLYCGIALAPLNVTDDHLRRLDMQGFRGLRFNFMRHLGSAMPVDDIVRLTPRLAAIGWHLQVHFDRSVIDELAPVLKRSSVPVIIDHMGRVTASEGVDQPAFSALCRLLDDHRFWVKVSGGDRVSATGAPYRDAAPFARRLVERFGDRTLWGTDWPHPNTPSPPDDGLLVDLLAEIATTPDEMKSLLVDNPQRLYGFPVPFVRDPTESTAQT